MAIRSHLREENRDLRDDLDRLETQVGSRGRRGGQTRDDTPSS